jgi:hypothetical protein
MKGSIASSTLGSIGVVAFRTQVCQNGARKETKKALQPTDLHVEVNGSADVLLGQWLARGGLKPKLVRSRCQDNGLRPPFLYVDDSGEVIRLGRDHE